MFDSYGFVLFVLIITEAYRKTGTDFFIDGVFRGIYYVNLSFDVKLWHVFQP